MAPPTWIEALGALREAGTPCAMVVVTDVEGSAPREAGARMLVTGAGLAWGTIGGGNLERLAIEEARALLEATERPPASKRFPLAEAAGQCCGGRVTLFFEPFRWRRRTVAIFGAGHVGQALAALAPWLQADVRLFDGRAEQELQPVPPGPERPYALTCIDAPEAEVDALPADALVLVMTHSHALDQAIIERALARGGFPYLGLIGSERKWAQFQRRLRAKGFGDADLARVRCPIGLTRSSKTPRAIALSVAAELSDAMARLPGGSAAAQLGEASSSA